MPKFTLLFELLKPQNPIFSDSPIFGISTNIYMGIMKMLNFISRPYYVFSDVFKRKTLWEKLNLILLFVYNRTPPDCLYGGIFF